MTESTLARQNLHTMTAITRRLKIRHTTRYAYDGTVDKSVHLLRLKPVHDARQTVLSHELQIDPSVETYGYEDVFGNASVRFEMNQPYQQMSITSTSLVQVNEHDPFAFAKVPIRTEFPLKWMPWEERMIWPYMSSEELPDTQVQDLYDQAMSFVNRNKGDLMETLFDMNLTLFRDYQYVPGSSNLQTTAFDTMVNRKGVCQDFANLFIAWARLLRIPARYVCGYIYTGNTGQNRAQSDASHAWVQLYIPGVGWKGFDPTNGVLPALNHVRTATGRHYRDTAPITGTIYSSAHETLTVDVEVSDVDV